MKNVSVKLFRLAVLLVAGLIVPSGYGITYSAFLDNSEWRMQGSELECGLYQPIPEIGDGVFSKKAGEPLAFYLKPFHNPMRPGEVSLVSEGPAWKPNLSSRFITKIEVTDAALPLEVKDPYAQIMLSHLNQGLMPTFATANIFANSDDEWVKIALSSANFQQAYQEYVTCLSHLLPVNFQQIARSAIFFNTNKAGFGDEVKQQLDLIIRFVKADKRVRRVFIDGHTDDTGNKKINQRLSRSRAESVASYLKKAGLNKKILITRFHADKYPALKNDSDPNRARNRRVTIRLERE